MGLLRRHSEAETPEDYREIMRSARTKPCPFEVVSFQRENFKQWGSFLAPKYTKRFTAPTRPIKEVRISQNKVRTIDHRDTYTGPLISTVITHPVKKSKKSVNCEGSRPSNTHTEPEWSYKVPVRLPIVKYNDLQVLKRFCRGEAQEFYSNLRHSQQGEGNEEDEDYFD